MIVDPTRDIKAPLVSSSSINTNRVLLTPLPLYTDKHQLNGVCFQYIFPSWEVWHRAGLAPPRRTARNHTSRRHSVVARLITISMINFDY